MLGRTIVVVTIAAVFFTLAGVPNTAEGGNSTRGMVVVGLGGGFLDEAMFINNIGEATFSFFGGYDKKGNFKGSFFAKRLIADAGIVSVKSTEITDVQVEIYGSGEDTYACMTMTGIADFMPTWSNQHFPRHTFTLYACDYDSFGDGIDTIWFEVLRSDGYVRPAISLSEYCELKGGNILIPLKGLE